MVRGLAGDDAAHAELLSRMSIYLRRYFARKLSSSDADVEDLVQETLLAIHLRRETWDHKEPFTPWAYAIARYKLIDQFRRRRIRRAEPIEAAEGLFSTDADDTAARLDVERLLSGIPDRQRQVLRDVRIEGLSTRDAARKAGMSESAAKVSVHRSLRALMRRVRDAN